MPTLQNQGLSRGPLADAAERLDRIVRAVKDRQLSETRTGPRIALTDSFAASPEEAWAKKFMTQGIGPAPTASSPVMFPPFAPVGPVPMASQGFFVGQPAIVSEPQGSTLPLDGASARDAGIGKALGKPGRKRSFLGWLLLGR